MNDNITIIRKGHFKTNFYGTGLSGLGLKGRNKPYMPTIKDIARQANVSVATVSRVINNYLHVSEKTRHQVLKAIEELNYKPNNLARSMRIKKTHTIGLLLADITNPFYAEIAKAVVNLANSFEYTVILCITNNDFKLQEEYINLLKQRQIDGFLFASVHLQDIPIKQLGKERVPFVLLNRRLKNNRNINYVVLDNEFGAYMAVEHLVKLGHQHIAFISGQQTFSTSSERYNGYKNALGSFGLSFDKELVIEGEYNEKKAYDSTLVLLKKSRVPTAIIAANDLMALSAIEAITTRGMRIPEDIAVVGFDDVEIARHSTIQLTTVAQNKHVMAEIATRNLIQIMEGKISQLPVQVTLKPQLIVRNTCGAKASPKLLAT